MSSTTFGGQLMPSKGCKSMWIPASIRAALTGAILLLAIAAQAAPPAFHAQFREMPQWAYISDCQDSASGGHCVWFDVVPGLIYYNVDTWNADEYVMRYFYCPTSDDAFEVDANASAFGVRAIIDAADCDQFVLKWNEATQTWEDADGFVGYLTFDIAMRDPEGTFSNVSNGVESYLNSSFQFECKLNTGRQYDYVTGTVNGLSISDTATSLATREQCNYGVADK